MVHSWLDKARWDRVPGKGRDVTGYLYVFGSDDPKPIAKIFSTHAQAWQKPLLSNAKEVLHFQGRRGPVWIVRPRRAPPAVSHGGMLEESPYSFLRDAVGALVSAVKASGAKQLGVEMHGTSREQELGVLTGLEIASYSFRDLQTSKPLHALPALSVKLSRGKVDASIVAAARARGRAVNTARHLVNLPPNELNPTGFAKAVKSMKLPKGAKVEVWERARLEKEGMGLHLAVGAGASHAPCLVHVRWRPAKPAGKPVALVGKGITFDSGGLDIKPSSGMRLMKKDMGGAAAVAATVLWAAETNCPVPIDAYLALAENAIDSNSFRPSDVVRARNGQLVEIDNTDAEGRLVLADALDVAVTRTGADEPRAVIDVATLTGAIKVALGADLAGLFSNDDGLATAINRAGQQAGDLNWRMPLAERYWGALASPFADFRNSAEGYGGAITAALFLSRFVRNRRWAHLDVYAWTDKASGALLSSGGSGQPVQCLIEWLENEASG